MSDFADFEYLKKRQPAVKKNDMQGFTECAAYWRSYRILAIYNGRHDLGELAREQQERAARLFTGEQEGAE